MIAARGNRDHPSGVGHRQRAADARRSGADFWRPHPIADLFGRVVAPSEDYAIGPQRDTMGMARRHRHDAVQRGAAGYRHQHRRRLQRTHQTGTELTEGIVAPYPKRSVALERHAMHETGRDGHDIH